MTVVRSILIGVLILSQVFPATVFAGNKSSRFQNSSRYPTEDYESREYNSVRDSYSTGLEWEAWNLDRQLRHRRSSQFSWHSCAPAHRLPSVSHRESNIVPNPPRDPIHENEDEVSSVRSSCYLGIRTPTSQIPKLEQDNDPCSSIPELQDEDDTKWMQGVPSVFDRGGSRCCTSELKGRLAFLGSILDPTEIFCPVTPRKVAFWLLYGGIASGYYFLDQNYDVTQKVSDAVHYSNLILLLGLYLTEPVMAITIALFAKYGDPPPIIEEESRIYPTPGSEEIAIIIPCHKSAGTAEQSIEACLNHVHPEQIFVVDNGNQDTPLDNLKDRVQAIHPKINYIWFPLGSKTIAQYVGIHEAKNFKYLLTIDDDVVLPENFDFSAHLLNDDVKVVCYPLRAIRSGNKPNLLVRWQDIEYKFADQTKRMEGRFCGVLFPHGAASLWEKETFKEALRRHDAVFYAEDVELGLILQDMGKKMAIADTALIDTEVPDTLMGPMPNYYTQRVRYWEVGRQHYFWEFAKRFVSCSRRDTCGNVALLKAFQGIAVAYNVVDWFRLPIFIFLGSNLEFWPKVGGAFFVIWVPVLFWNYVKLRNRPDIQVDKWAVATFPAYKVVYSIAATLALGRFLFVNLPNFKKRSTIPELERMNHPCTKAWLDSEDQDSVKFEASESESKTGERIEVKVEEG